MGLFRNSAAGLAAAVICLAGGAAIAQPPAAAPAAAPDYMVINLSIDVNAPAKTVWEKVGKFCDLGEWLQVPCQITLGEDNQPGAVRTIAGRIKEVLVSKTDLSYTYAQPLAPDQYHGSVEVVPTGPNTSKIKYMIFRDQSSLPDQAAKDKDRAQRTAQFTQAIQNMKTIAEGGTLPPRSR